MFNKIQKRLNKITYSLFSYHKQFKPIPKLKIMKTIAKTILTAIFSLSSIFIFAEIPDEVKSENVNNDPNTKSIKALNKISTTDETLNLQNNFLKEEEMYIEDIPFNTEEIANKVLRIEYYSTYKIEKPFYLEDESYIDDIPFDTYEIAFQKFNL